MEHKQIYLAGGMGAFGAEEFEKANEWRVDITNQLENISGSKITTVNPNEHFNFLDETDYESEMEVMLYDLHRVKESDIIIINFNHIESLGSMAELAISYDMRKPIYGLCENGEKDKLHPWQKCMCNRIFTDREDLVAYIIKHHGQD